VSSGSPQYSCAGSPTRRAQTAAAGHRRRSPAPAAGGPRSDSTTGRTSSRRQATPRTDARSSAKRVYLAARASFGRTGPTSGGPWISTPRSPTAMFDAALAFLARAFGLEPVVFDAASTEIRFAAVRHGSGMVMVQPQLPSERHGSHAGRGWVYVAVDDPDEHHRRAEAAAPSCWARRTTAWADASAATAHAIRRATSGASEPPTRRKCRRRLNTGPPTPVES
jgi:hypothetical protein